MIEVRDLSFGYRPGEPIIQNFNGTFSAGHLTAISGVSGRGKSTLLYLLGLLLRPWSGQIVVEGNNLAGLTDTVRSQIRANEIGFVFQDAALDATRTVLDNIIEPALYSGLAPKVAKGRAREMVQQFGVDLRLSHKPGEVSGGQAQRVALCRALLNQPSIILADEPTGNLDPATANVVLEALRGYAEGGAIVIIATHDPIVINAANRVLAL